MAMTIDVLCPYCIGRWADIVGPERANELGDENSSRRSKVYPYPIICDLCAATETISKLLDMNEKLVRAKIEQVRKRNEQKGNSSPVKPSDSGTLAASIRLDTTLFNDTFKRIEPEPTSYFASNSGWSMVESPFLGLTEVRLIYARDPRFVRVLKGATVTDADVELDREGYQSITLRIQAYLGSTFVRNVEAFDTELPTTIPDNGNQKPEEPTSLSPDEYIASLKRNRKGQLK